MITKICVLVLYILVLLGIGVYTLKKASSYGGFNLAGRGNNKWIGGISTQSASTSGWMLLGLPGLAYAGGFSVVWTITGWLTGSLINWLLIGKRLRIATEIYDDAVSCTEYFERRTDDKKGIIGIVSALTIVILMVINSSSEMIGFGKLLTAVFHIDYTLAVTVGLLVVAIYTFLGGYMAVSWSNLLQGSLMFMALAIVPIVAIADLDGFANMAEQLVAKDPDYFKFLGGDPDFASVVLSLTAGLGISMQYPGMVHSLTGIMSIKDPNEVKDSALIATVWGAVALLGASGIGMAGRVIFPNAEDPEQVFLLLGEKYFPTAFFAVLGAAVMAAILSSVCAYLIVSSASVGGCIARRYVGKEKMVVFIEKALVVLMALTAYILALRGGSLHTITMFASAGLGAAFGPLVIFSLFTNAVNAKGAVASILTGLITVMVWFYSGLSNYVFEAVPGFLVSTIVLFAVSKATGGPKSETSEKYYKFISEYKKVQNARLKEKA